MGIYVVLLPKCLNNENISTAPETSAGQSLYVLSPTQPFSAQRMSHHSESRGLSRHSIVVKQRETLASKNLLMRESCVSKT